MHNSMSLHSLDVWDETSMMYVPYESSPVDNLLLSGSDYSRVSLQTSHGRFQNVNIDTRNVGLMMARGVWPSNPKKRATRNFSFRFLDVCQRLTQVASVSQTNLQRVFGGEETPDHDVFNEAFLFYRVIRLELVQRLFQRLDQETLPPQGHLFRDLFVCPHCLP